MQVRKAGVRNGGRTRSSVCPCFIAYEHHGAYAYTVRENQYTVATCHNSLHNTLRSLSPHRKT